MLHRVHSLHVLKMGSIMNLHFMSRELTRREVKSLAQGHTTKKWQSLALEPRKAGFVDHTCHYVVRGPIVIHSASFSAYFFCNTPSISTSEEKKNWHSFSLDHVLHQDLQITWICVTQTVFHGPLPL